MTTELTAINAVRINAPAAAIWQLITTSNTVTDFMMGMKPETDWQEGSDINWTAYHSGAEHDMAKGVIKKMNPNEKLEYSFFYTGLGQPDVPENYQAVIISLQPIDEHQTEVTASQGDYGIFSRGEVYLQHADNFWKQALAKLKQMAESS